LSVVVVAVSVTVAIGFSKDALDMFLAISQTLVIFLLPLKGKTKILSPLPHVSLIKLEFYDIYLG